MLDIFRNRGLGSLVTGAMIVATVLVFVIQFNPDLFGDFSLRAFMTLIVRNHWRVGSLDRGDRRGGAEAAARQVARLT